MTKVFNSLGIDLIYLLIQTFNFLLVFLILYKFLVKPLSKIINEREEKISKGLKLLSESEEIIEKTKKLRDNIISNAEKERIEILNKANEEKKRIIEKIYEEAERERKEILERIKQEEMIMEKMIVEKMKNISFETFYELAKKIFHQKDLDQKFIESIIRKYND
jgi:F-type H+-transporting ATPase subunit b